MTTSVFPCKRPIGMEDWQSSVSSETVETAKKLFKDSQELFAGTANFMGVGEKGNYSSYWNRGCHASMGNPDSNCRDVLVTENGLSRRIKSGYGDGFSYEICRPFLKWFLYDSPYGFIILNRDDLDYCEQVGFVLAGDAPTTMVQSACIISRHFYEVALGSFLEFNKLVERGIDGFIAYQLCFNSNISLGYCNPQTKYDMSTRIFETYGGHRVSGCVNPDVMLHYYRGEVQGTIENSYKKAPSIYGSTRLFIPTSLYPTNYQLSIWRKSNKAFHEFLLEKEGKLDRSGIYRPPNPFTQKAVENNEFKFTLEQALTHVADYIQQYIKEALNV